MTLEELEEKYKKHRDAWEEEHRIRIHRAISWLKSSVKYIEDRDIAFIGTLNAMNACWGQLGVNDKDAIEKLANNLHGTEAMKQITNLYRTRDGDRWLRGLIENKYLYWQYWRYLQGEMDETRFLQQARSHRSYARGALESGNYKWLLKATMTQTVVLRSQVFHGFTTYHSEQNKEVITLTAKMMRKLAIIVINAMIDEPNRDWGTTPWTFGNPKKAEKGVEVKKAVKSRSTLSLKPRAKAG